MRRSISHIHLTRRAAISGALMSPLVAVAVDPHPTWLDQWRDARAAINEHFDDADTHPLWPLFEGLEQRILQTPALTTAGIAAQLTLLAQDDAYAMGDIVTDALTRAAAVLNQMGPSQKGGA